MALAHYVDTFWFPNGALATNIPARIFVRSGPALAQLWTDVTGTVALPNPLSTNGAGVLDFWAEEGEYYIHLDTETFRVSVGNPVGLDVFDGASQALSTGVMSGGRLALSANPVAVDFSETVGYVVDYSTDDFRPSLTRVHVNAQTVLLDAAALLRDVTFWFLDAGGNFIQQAAPPSPTTRRQFIYLGFSVLAGGSVFLVESTPVILPQPRNQMQDLMEFLGPFSITGNIISPNGVNLSTNKTAGTMFSPAFNYATVPDNPHMAVTPAQTPTTVRYSLRNTVVFPPYTTTLDVANYDNGGVLTPIPGGANVSTLQRVFLFALDNTIDQVAIQYGQATYPNLAAAAAAAGKGSFVVNPVFIGTLIGWIAVTKSAPNLSDPAQATFITASKFSTP